MRKLRRIRAEKGLTMDTLEERAGVSKRTISEIERGVRTPHTLTLAKLANALEVDLDELLEDEAPKVEAPPSPDLPKEGGAGAEALLAWLEHLDLTLERAEELRSEFRELAEYTRNTPREEREPVVAERRIAWVFSGCLEFSMAISRAVKVYRKRLAPLLEGGELSPREEELIRAMRSRLEELHPIRRRFLDLIERTHHLTVDIQHAEKMLRELGQELSVPDWDAVPKDV